ncbi:hypothetical protein BURMUCF2_0831 [Burkholderia multivorans CF2]|nr:hypothetical protein BURMUCF2_0831 [Burkholderia multivorans CF2]
MARRVVAVQRIIARLQRRCCLELNDVPFVPRSGSPRPQRNRIPLPRRTVVRELRRQGARGRADEMDRRGRVCMRGGLVQPLLRDGQRRQHPLPASDPRRQPRRAEGACGRDRAYQHAHSVSVHAGDPKGGVLRQTTDCLVVFVAVDENGNPLPVPTFVPETDEQKRLAKYAMDVRAALDKIVEMKPEEVAKGEV